MQNIENDMDDLFKRAAEEYPLDISHGDWESVEKRLALAEPRATKGTLNKNNYKKLFLLVLLIVLFSSIGFMILTPGSKNYFTNKYISEKNKETVKNNNAVSATALDNVDPVGKDMVPNSLATTKKRKETAERKILTQRKIIQGRRSYKGDNKNLVSENVLTQVIPDSEVRNDEKNVGNFQMNNKPDLKSTKNYSKAKQDSLVSANENSISVTDTSKNKVVVLSVKKTTKAKKKNIKENGVYAGLLSGLDFSKVKSTSFKGAGFGAGLLIGYKANSFFVETGISREFKYYSSMGHMFNDKDGLMPSGTVIENLESRSNILEIPLKVGYTFHKKQKNSLFFAGGAALYIMTNEKNNYNVTMNGNPEKMVGLYKKNTVKFPAVVSISAGWEYSLERSLRIRIEPVLKLPLKGIGIGRLPVTSMGIQLGITKKFK